MFKAVLFCVFALSLQSIAGQCIGAGWGGWGGWDGPLGLAGPLGAYDGFGAYGAYGAYGGCGPAILASSGGGLGVASASAIPPRGVSVLSENAIEGPLAVAGALPFLGTVALEGVLPTAGAGAVNYGCGNGAVAILAEDINAGLAGPLAYGVGPWAGDAYGYGPYGYGIGGLAGPFRGGCGCGALL